MLVNFSSGLVLIGFPKTNGDRKMNIWLYFDSVAKDNEIIQYS